MSGEDYDAQAAERYGWVNRALPVAALGDFVKSLAHRIAAIKERVNALALVPAEGFRRDSTIFLECVRSPEAQNRIKPAIKRGFQTREAEMALPHMLSDLDGSV